MRVSKNEIQKLFTRSVTNTIINIARSNRYESGYKTGMAKNNKGYIYDMASFDLEMMISLQEKRIKTTTSKHHKKMRRTLDRLLKIKRELENV